MLPTKYDLVRNSLKMRRNAKMGETFKKELKILYTRS